MYKKNMPVSTCRGNGVIIATQTDPHIVNGPHPFLNIGDEEFPEEGKDYIIALPNDDKQSELDYVHQHIIEKEIFGQI